jgi:purine-binding chemotaxis protein CheW
MKTGKSVVVFLIEGYRYGMPLDMVERVAPVVEITPVPDAPDAVMGVINVRGRVMPVINLRKKLSMQDRALKLSDQLLICHVGERTMALLVETIEGATEYSDEDLSKPDGNTSAEQVLKTADGIVYIYDYERLLNSQEQIVLKKAMEKVSA